jgi:glycosyltransferase involved in cell wall biosynthesis
MRQGLISVLVPSYNHANFLGTCLDRVLSQSRRPVQIVVIDDGSEDESPTVLQQYRRLVTVVEREHRGLRATVAEGLRLVTGDYVLMLASDDVIDERALEYLALPLDEYPNVAVAFGGIRIVDGEGKVLGDDPVRRPTGLQTDPGPLMKACYIPAPAALCRVAALRSVPEPIHVLCGDWERWVTLMCAGWYTYGIGTVVAGYRRHGANLTGLHRMAAKLLEEIDVLETIAARHNLSFSLRRAAQQALASRYRTLGWMRLTQESRPSWDQFIRALTLTHVEAQDVMGLLASAMAATFPTAYNTSRSLMARTRTHHLRQQNEGE